MWKRREKGERIRKWREIHSPYFFILSFFPPSLSISYLKICRKMLKKAQKNKINILNEEKILGRIRCEEALQVVPACCKVDCLNG